MPLTLVRTTDATSEPVSLAELKDHLRVDDANSDTLIASLGVAAREVAETWTRRQFITAPYTFTLDRFPYQGYDNYRFGAPPQAEGSPLYSWCMHRNIIRIPVAPVLAVSSIAYIDTAGATQTLSASNYILDKLSEPARLTPAYSLTWPATQARINAVTISFTAGWANASVCPAKVKHLIRLLVGDYFENRVPVGDPSINNYTAAVRLLTASLSWGDYR